MVIRIAYIAFPYFFLFPSNNRKTLLLQVPYINDFDFYHLQKTTDLLFNFNRHQTPSLPHVGVICVWSIIYSPYFLIFSQDIYCVSEKTSSLFIHPFTLHIVDRKKRNRSRSIFVLFDFFSRVTNNVLSMISINDTIFVVCE